MATRNPIARALRQPALRSRIIRDKRKESRRKTQMEIAREVMKMRYGVLRDLADR